MGLAQDVEPPAEGAVRIATFNVSLTRPQAEQLATDLEGGDDGPAKTIAQIIQHVRPDVILLNEFDFDESGETLRSFREQYLGADQGGGKAIEYEFSFIAPVNTGVASGHDLDNDGSVGGANDAFGFGQFEGQYGMAVLSRFPILEDRVRTFQSLRWRDMPGAMIPEGWFTDDELAVVRLSSKSHWDVPIDLGEGRTIHLLCSHPTPPVFDGPEDRNGRRNHDEIRFWVDYLNGGEASEWIVDDAGEHGGLGDEAHFVVLGDLNSDPDDGGSIAGAIMSLLGHERVSMATAPQSLGAEEQARLQGGANESHKGDPALDTADFNDRERGPGNLRVDYALPSRTLEVIDFGVFWPLVSDPLFPLVGAFPFLGSDHRLVWVDVSAR